MVVTGYGDVVTLRPDSDRPLRDHCERQSTFGDARGSQDRFPSRSQPRARARARAPCPACAALRALRCVRARCVRAPRAAPLPPAAPHADGGGGLAALEEEEGLDEEAMEAAAERILDAEDPYEVLDVARDEATDELVRGAHERLARGLGRLPSWAQEPGIRSDIEQRLHEARDALRTAEARARTAALPSSGADESPSWRQSGRSAAPEAAPAAASPEVVPAAREVTFSGTLDASPVPA